MNKAHLFFGLPGSGKSTIANDMTRKDPRLVIICADSIGQMLRGTYSSYSSNFSSMRGLAAKIAQEAVKQAIDGGFDFILDETNLTRSARGKWVRFIDFYCRQTMKDYKVILTPFPGLVSNPAILEPLSDKEKKWIVEQQLKHRMENPKGVPRKIWKEILTRMVDKMEPISEAEYREYGEIIFIGENIIDEAMIKKAAKYNEQEEKRQG